MSSHIQHVAVTGGGNYAENDSTIGTGGMNEHAGPIDDEKQLGGGETTNLAGA